MQYILVILAPPSFIPLAPWLAFLITYFPPFFIIFCFIFICGPLGVTSTAYMGMGMGLLMGS